MDQNNKSEVEVRDEMKSFWEEHSTKADVKEMMLDENAEELGKHEIPEIMSLLPDVSGKRVLELGAGIGRFTGLIAKEALHVTANDFMQAFVDKNKELNGHYGNVDFICGDATKLNFPNESFDVIFSNWLFMYLDDIESEKLFIRMATWLKKDGFLFFRESCFHPSGNKARSFNPTKYRHPTKYLDFIEKSSDQMEGSNQFEIILSRSIQTYIMEKNNQNQVAWLFHKVERSTNFSNGLKTPQAFLDTAHYTAKDISKHEFIFKNEEMAFIKELTLQMNLKSGESILDVGCGTGQSSIYMAESFGVTVVGMDLSHNMMNEALKNLNKKFELNNKILFEVADVMKREYSDSKFDAIFCRDASGHIENKVKLLKRFYKWLKPGGRLFLCDIVTNEAYMTEEFKTYLEEKHLFLISKQSYQKILSDGGFININSHINVENYGNFNLRSLNNFKNMKNEFLMTFSEEEYQQSLRKLEEILKQINNKERSYVVFTAQRPE